MSIPLLEYAPTSQNQRVVGFEVPGDDQPWIYTTDNLLSASDMDDLIAAAYRQIFNEQQMTLSSRQKALESQLRAGQITVREFIRGLATSDLFRSRNYETNNNYRFVQMCVRRILGREVYNDREKLAWSILLATKGLQGFIDALLNSREYLDSFGDNVVPFQRRRILPQRHQGELPFARMPRYAEDHLAYLESLGNDFKRRSADLSNYTPDYNWRPPKIAQQVGAAITIGGAAGLGLLLIAVAFACFGWIHL